MQWALSPPQSRLCAAVFTDPKHIAHIQEPGHRGESPIPVLTSSRNAAVQAAGFRHGVRMGSRQMSATALIDLHCNGPGPLRRFRTRAVCSLAPADAIPICCGITEAAH